MLQAAVKSSKEPEHQASLWEGKERGRQRLTKTGASLVPQPSASFCSIK